MMTVSHCRVRETHHVSRAPVRCTHPTGFTLVELLVVIAIIAMLAGLVTGAAVMARGAAKRAVIAMEINQLEQACQMYKEKFGEYPPDFTNQNAVLRHLARAFPRYQPGISTGAPTNDWAGFYADVFAVWQLAGTPMDVNNLSPASALTFWLGGMPTWSATNTLTGFNGFSANPLNPFDNGASRINKFYDFALTPQTSIFVNQLMYYPTGVTGNTATNSYVYFRAENGNYTLDGSPMPTGTMKSYLPPPSTALVLPAADWRLMQVAPYVWINPQSFQIFSAGLDATYTAPTGAGAGPLQFPTGGNYDPAGRTYDDITNFAGGTLESRMP